MYRKKIFDFCILNKPQKNSDHPNKLDSQEIAILEEAQSILEVKTILMIFMFEKKIQYSLDQPVQLENLQDLEFAILLKRYRGNVLKIIALGMNDARAEFYRLMNGTFVKDFCDLLEESDVLKQLATKKKTLS